MIWAFSARGQLKFTMTFKCGKFGKFTTECERLGVRLYLHQLPHLKVQAWGCCL